MFFVLFLLFEENCHQVLENEIGIKNYRNIELGEGEKICMNLTYYPTFLIFEDFEKDTKFYSIVRSPLPTSPVEQKSTYLRYLKNYKSFIRPFGEFYIEAESAASVSFTVLSMPGMCQDGIFISTNKNEEIELSPKSEGIMNLDSMNDKCVINTVKDTSNISVSFSSDSNWSQIYVYKSLTEFEAVGANETYEKNETKHTRLIRIITGNYSNDNRVNIKFASDGDEGYNPRSDFFVYENIADKCKDEAQWVTNEIAVTFVIIAAALILAIVIVIGKMCYDEKDNHLSVEENNLITETTSLATMDDSLFPSISTLYN